MISFCTYLFILLNIFIANNWLLILFFLLLFSVAQCFVTVLEKFTVLALSSQMISYFISYLKLI